MNKHSGLACLNLRNGYTTPSMFSQKYIPPYVRHIGVRDLVNSMILNTIFKHFLQEKGQTPFSATVFSYSCNRPPAPNTLRFQVKTDWHGVFWPSIIDRRGTRTLSMPA